LPIFKLNFDLSSHVAWSVSCPKGRIEEGKPLDPFVLSYSLPSILPRARSLSLRQEKIGIFSLKNWQKSAFH
jgi:hypothetical protein